MNQWHVKQWVGLLALSFAVFMVSLDITIVAVVLPMIERDLHLDFEDMQWLINTYVLSYGSLLVVAGVLADHYGRRRVFLLGLSLFAVASAACGLAPTGLWLNLARIAQGGGGAALATCSMALVTSIFRKEDRSAAYGVWAMAVGLGLAFGPMLGGQIGAYLDWRGVFLINVPVALLIVSMAMRSIPESVDPHTGKFDFYGLAVFIPTLAVLIYALTKGNVIGWFSLRAILMFLLSILLFVAFVAIECHSKRPLFDLSLFAVPTFVGVSIVSIAASIGYWSLFIYIPLYLDRVLHLSTAAMGMVMLPLALPMLVIPPFAARLSGWLAPHMQFAFGLGLIAAGDFYLAAAMGSHGGLMVPLFLTGAGAGLINAQITHVAVSVVPLERSGMASGISATMRQLGYAVGVAGLGAILSSTSQALLLTSVAAHPKLGIVSAVAQAGKRGFDAQLISGLSAPLQQTFLDLAAYSFAAGFHTTLLVAGAISLAGAVLAFVLVRQKDLYHGVL